jgi:8-oxo-dGTP pyrophosphatase MutT (NUDIX family)
LDMQEKFTAAMRELAEERNLELIVEHTYAGSGYYSLQPRESFDPVLRFPFDFRTGYSSFVGGVGDPGPLGLRADDSPWSCVRGGEHDEVLARVTEILVECEAESRPRSGELAGAAR